ncbi:MAG: hypothetical protein ACAI43_23415 [Phycisphaerae bacterium]|nr:hypothetical protein [Tepidisphaeraceae bacterium]
MLSYVSAKPPGARSKWTASRIALVLHAGVMLVVLAWMLIGIARELPGQRIYGRSILLAAALIISAIFSLFLGFQAWAIFDARQAPGWVLVGLYAAGLVLCTHWLWTVLPEYLNEPDQEARPDIAIPIVWALLSGAGLTVVTWRLVVLRRMRWGEDRRASKP